MTKSTIDKKIDWEKFIEENCGFDESVINWKEIQGQYDSERDQERKRYLDLILWKADHVDSLTNAKKTYLKYKETENISKAFEYIFKKLRTQVRYIPEAQAAMDKVNEQAMLAYEKILDLCMIRDTESLKQLQKDLDDFDTAKR